MSVNLLLLRILIALRRIHVIEIIIVVYYYIILNIVIDHILIIDIHVNIRRNFCFLVIHIFNAFTVLGLRRGSVEIKVS